VPIERWTILHSIASIRNEIFDIRKGTYHGRKQRHGVAPEMIPLSSDVALVMRAEESIERPRSPRLAVDRGRDLAARNLADRGLRQGGSSPPPATTSSIT
jgi:hypothetical protein